MSLKAINRFKAPLDSAGVSFFPALCLAETKTMIHFRIKAVTFTAVSIYKFCCSLERLLPFLLAKDRYWEYSTSFPAGDDLLVLLQYSVPPLAQTCFNLY